MQVREEHVEVVTVFGIMFGVGGIINVLLENLVATILFYALAFSCFLVQLSLYYIWKKQTE